jgi:hypothetical protein
MRLRSVKKRFLERAASDGRGGWLGSGACQGGKNLLFPKVLRGWNHSKGGYAQLFLAKGQTWRVIAKKAKIGSKWDREAIYIYGEQGFNDFDRRSRFG